MEKILGLLTFVNLLVVNWNVSIAKAQPAKDSTVLIVQSQYQKVQLLYQDAFGDIRMLIANPSKQHADTFHLYVEQPFVIKQADITQTPYLLVPGDTVIFQYSEQKFPIVKHLHNNMRSSELNFYRSLYQNRLANQAPAAQLNTASRSLIRNKDDIAKYINYLTDQYKADSSYFSEYIKSKAVSPYFNSYVQWQLQAQLVERLAQGYCQLFQFNNPTQSKLLADKAIAQYQKFSKIPYHTPYTILLTHELWMNQLYCLQEFQTSKNVSALFKTTSKLIHPTARNQVRFLVLKQYAKEMSREEFNEKVAAMPTSPINYKAYLQRYIENKSTAGDYNIYKTASGRGMYFEEIRSMFPGKALFLIFWHSQQKQSQEIFAKLKHTFSRIDTNKVSLIYVSLEKSYQSWQHSQNIVPRNLRAAHSYWLAPGMLSSIIIKNEINSLPCALIFDRQGIVTGKHVLEGSQQVVNYINKL
ncbi:hypothetical protein COR50_20410 [Chitinophaga caeni]|uniref:Thioredoxin-like fold domain-containing protein n=1 Tax=Chitinophaga caeni TaxID=2029983 RepID=A0A291QZ97_9BACT|nr:thioredoxin-like domain-containing protein [Chitinophaga caeni]ATL49349.1 hypothetical protein COR50_20410 [Chitinophaga caeni]